MQKSEGRKLQLEVGEEFAARQGRSFAPRFFFRLETLLPLRGRLFLDGKISPHFEGQVLWRLGHLNNRIVI